MSQRGKRGSYLHHPRIDVEPQPPPTKRRKGRPPNGGGGGLGGGLGGGGCSGAGPGNNTHFTSTQSNINCVRNSICGSTTSVDPDTNQHNTGVVGDEITSATSAKAIGSQGSSSSAATWQARSVSDIKMSSIYNRSSTEAPAELYRKDLISAMKLPDSEQLSNYEYLVVNDQWKQEWERGVQVPVNPDSLPEPYVEVLTEPIVPPAHDFKLPKNRFLRITKDENYSPELHCLTNVVALAENTCAYDIDRIDEAWLKLYNADRKQFGAYAISETQFERVIEELEIRCWEQIQVILKNEEGLGIEYDENVICDVCRSPDSEEANEMVFCDNCNICVHQACYGITAIPSGQWLCRTCSMGIKPDCVLCPNKGGAMKSSKSGKHWAHVSCALWIPEVSIGCVDRMEPITKISSIPTSRWALLCVLCRGRDGACIQCSIKTCKTAYHVTCAFQHGLEMRAIIEEGNAEDGVKLRSYCHKHSVSKGKKDANSSKGISSTSCKNRMPAGNASGTDDDDCRRRKSRKSDMTSEERNQVRARRLQEVESEFDKHVNIKDISCHLFDVDDEAVEAIYNYWKLKRKSRNNRALIPPKSEDVEMIARKQEQQDLENHKLVVHLRQDLERVRNLCYMVSRREKLSRSLFKLREQVFYKQISVLTDASLQTSDKKEKHDEQFKNAVIYANDGPTLYDRFYSSCDKNTPTQYQSLDFILEKLLGSSKNVPKTSNRLSRTSTSLTKRANKQASSTVNTTSVTCKTVSTKKVNNGAVISSNKTSSLMSALNDVNEKQLVKRGPNTSRRATSTSTDAPATTTPILRCRTSAARTSLKNNKNAKNSNNSSDETSSSSGSTSSDDDSSSNNDSTSASASSSVSGSESSSSESESSLQSCKVNALKINKQTVHTKRKACQRTIEEVEKERKRSITQSKIENSETKTSAKASKDLCKTDITTVHSSSSEVDTESKTKNKHTVSAPPKLYGNKKSTTDAGMTKKTVPNTSNLILLQTENNNILRTNNNESSSSDETIEVTPKKCRKPLAKSVEGNKNFVTRKKNVNATTCRKSIEKIYSDSECSSDLDNKEKEEKAAESNVSDSQNQQTIRTKAAMKEFTLQQQTCNKIQPDLRTCSKTSGKSEKTKDLNTDTHEISTKISPQQKANKISSDLLVVPQRQAAKKASENMRSTNTITGISSLTYTNTSNVGQLQKDIEIKHRETLTKQKDIGIVKPDEKAEKKNNITKFHDQNSEKPIANKRGRPPKNSRDTNEPSQSVNSIFPDRLKELQISNESETKKLYSLSTEEEKSPHNRPLTSESSKSSTSNEISKNNILVAYVVPQRQAAKKAAEQLKSSNKTSQIITESATTPSNNTLDEKERVTFADKDPKLKALEDRTSKPTPLRRMSTRDSSNLSNKNEGIAPTVSSNKTVMCTRRRSKDDVQATNPKRPLQPVDKKRKISITSSSESDSSSSSSSSDGSEDSSSNSGSSYSSSSSEDEVTETDEKENIQQTVPRKENTCLQKAIESTTNTDENVENISLESSEKHITRNENKSAEISLTNNKKQSLTKSNIQTRRKSSFLEEHELDEKIVINPQIDDTKCIQSVYLSPSKSMPNKMLSNKECESNNNLNEKETCTNSDLNKEKDSDFDLVKATILPSESVVDKKVESQQENKANVTIENVKEAEKNVDKIPEKEKTKNDEQISESLINSSDTELVGKNNSYSRDECSEVPMDIDEELTTAPTNTTLPSEEHSLLKTDELLINLDPPAAPMPVSPTALSSSSGEENDDQSNESNEDQENLNSIRKRKSRGRRRTIGSPPISAEEEHTHHTQHLLNEMELVKALEEERKKDLAASKIEESIESKSPSVKIVGPEHLEIIELDSNSNSEKAATSPKQSLDDTSNTPLKRGPLESSYGDPSSIVNKEQSNIDNLDNESNFATSGIDPSAKNSCHPLTITTQNSTIESGHHPIVDTILDLEDNAKKKQEENQQQMHNFPNVLLNSSPFGSHSVRHVLDQHSESLSNLLTIDNNARKKNSDEDSFQATKNLLEKLRKTKRNRADDQKEPDLMQPPPTPAIPSVFPFHNAADPEDISYAQKESSLSVLEGNSVSHYNIESSQPPQTTTNITNNNNLLINSSPNEGAVSKTDNSIDIYGTVAHTTTDTARTSADAANICSINNSMSLRTYLEESGQSVQPHPPQNQLPISPMQQHSSQQTPKPHRPRSDATPNSNYNQQQSHTPTQQTSNVEELTSLIQSELVSQNTSSINKTPTLENFGQKQNTALSSNNPISVDQIAGTTPDFVDLHAAAAASKDFSSSASIRSNKLVVDCDFDENTRMQSPYAMQANRIWNENDLIAARRSTSPSSVSESNDQTPSIDLQQQPQQQQQTPVQHQIPIQGSHVQSQQHSITPNVLNSSNNNAINKNSFFSSINNFDITSSFQQHQIQPQNQLNQQSQQQTSISNGIDPLMYNQSYNSTPTSTNQGTSQQQSNVQQQAATQQFNGSVNLFNDGTTTLPNLNQISFVSNDTSSASGGSVMYPAGPSLRTNVNSATAVVSQQSRPDIYAASSTLGGTNSSAVQYSGAAFTSSTHNIALTAAIVGVSGGSSLIDHTSPRHHQMRSSHQYNLTSPSNTNSSTSFNNLHLGSCSETILTNQTQTPHHTTPTKDSPSKPNRSSTRFCQQSQQVRSSHKSPQVAQHKSPGKSPRQMELLSKQLQQQRPHTSLTEYTNLTPKQSKYDPLTHTLAGKPRQRAPRGTGSGSRGRGRGRGRNRGNNVPNTLISLPIPMSEYVSADNLVGTPFEFSYEEEMATPGMENLQSLRDRRRSFDCRNSQNSEALKYRSPSYNASSCKLRINTGSTSVSTASSGTGTESIVNCNSNLKGSNTSNLHSIVQPMLPGPVDMRTYNLGFEPQHSSASQEAYNNNLLGAFDSGTADQTLSEFDEDDEREFQSTLRATGTSSVISTKQLHLSMTSAISTSLLVNSKAVDSVTISNNNLNQTYTQSMTSTSIGHISSVPESISNIGIKSISTTATAITCQASAITTAISSAELVTDLQTSMETTSEDVSIDSDTTLTTKASLSDAGNQLKLKIKGPLAYPDNYNSSNANVHTSTATQSSIGNVQSMVSTNVTMSSSVGSSGTNSRRMRKKELLSLYVVQKDTHGDDSSCGLPPTDSSLLSNTIETTRKTESVCSEVDEYGSDFIAGSNSNKRFKKNSSRELRSLDIVGDIIENTTGMNLGLDGRRKSGCSSGSTDNSTTKIGAACSAGKRRGRSKTLEGIEDEPTPKLKIKIRGLTEGNVSANNYEVTRRSAACPPKKRLTSNYTPTLEDLKRDSMNYRDQVMQEFGGDDDERIKHTSGSNSNYSNSLMDMPHSKKMKSAKSKKEKKDKKRHKNKDLDDTETNVVCNNDNSMITTLIEQPTSASPGEPPKLILRINKRKTESTATDTSRSSPVTGLTTATYTLSPEGPSAPIRLKLARVSEGGGYVIGNKKRKKGKKSNTITNAEDLTNANSNTSCIIAVNASLSIADPDKLSEDATAHHEIASPIENFCKYRSSANEPQSRAETVSDVAKDSSTPSPCLVIDSSKSNDIQDSSNTASSLNDISVPCISESIHSFVVTPTAMMTSRSCNDNSNSQSSLALSNHSHLSNSNSNSLMSVAHQSQNSAGNISSIINQNNNINTNSNNNNNNSNSNNSNSTTGSSSGILALKKNCEVR